MLSGRIAVVGNPDFRRIALEQPRLFERERRAERRADAGHPRLYQRDHVHVTLREDHALEPALLFEQIGGKHAEPLVEYRRIARVQVFGLHIAQRAPAEAEHTPLRVDDGKDGALPEHIIHAAFPPHGDSRAHQLVVRKPKFAHRPRRAIALRRRCAKAEDADGAVAQLPPVQIFQNLRAFLFPELCVKKARALTVRLVKPLLA